MHARVIAFACLNLLIASAVHADLTTGLVGYWKFDEGSGTTVKDETSNNLSIRLTGTVSWIDGKYGKGYSFNGQNPGLIDNKAILNDPGSGLAITAWVTRGTAAGGYKIFISREYQTGMFEYWGAGWQDGKNILIVSGDGSTYKVVSGGTSPVDKWFHYAVSYNASNTTVTLYIDGAKVTEQNVGYTFSYKDKNPIAVGGNSNNAGGGKYYNDAYTGKMDELRLYNRPLTAAEVTEIFSGSTAVSGPFAADARATPASSKPWRCLSSNLREVSGSRILSVAGREARPTEPAAQFGAGMYIVKRRALVPGAR